MKKIFLGFALVAVLVFGILLLVYFNSNSDSEQNSQIANPASIYCEEQGGSLEITTAEDGSQSGTCTLTDGTKCEEWAYFRRECPANETELLVEEVQQKETTQEKFLVNFPWTNGEKWTLTTDFHDENCLDFDTSNDNNVAVVAAADGQVILSTHSYPNSFNTYSPVETDNPEDMGNFVIIQHNKDTYSVYMHFQQEANPPVKAGDYVKAGQRIGYKGDTGWSHGSHLHFCVIDISIFPTPSFITKPLDSWGFIEMNGSNILTLNKQYTSQVSG